MFPYGNFKMQWHIPISHLKQYSTFRDKIIGFEQREIYTNPGEFRLEALSFRDSK